MTRKRTFARYCYVLGWRLRYLWLDTPLGPRCRLTAAALVAVFAAWQFVDGMQAVAEGQPVQAIWPQIAMLVISMLISYALTPKPPDAVDQPGQVPKVDDGAGVRMVFGEVWITDPAVIGWKKIGTQTIRGKKSGFNGRPIIGYWYKQLFHFVLCRGPVDAVLEFRGGDKVAWQGELAASGDVQINKKDLWGGTGPGGEGGIEGPMEFLFGDAAQMPNSYLASALGPQQPAYRGLLAALFKGGLWGAFSPYPKTASFKVRRILHGWEREEGAWYPERAIIDLLARSDSVLDWIATVDPRNPGNRHQYRYPGSGGVWRNNLSDAVGDALSKGEFNRYIHVIGWSTDQRSMFPAVTSSPSADVLFLHFNSVVPTHPQHAYIPSLNGPSSSLACGAIAALIPSIQPDSGWWWWSGIESEVAHVPPGVFRLREAMTEHLPGESGINNCTNYPPVGGMFPVVSGVVDGVIEVRRVTLGAQAMNPAHMLYQSITDSWMGAEPEAQINDASFRAAADAMYGEGFGLCTQWISSDESVEAFQQRICDVIGANLSRSPIDGKWHLDLIRGGYDTSSLPVLTDDDILDYTEQPGTLVDTVNQVIVEWRDPQQREDRSTAPVQSLGSIQAAGAVIGEVSTYREIPEESLALRVAGRDLQAKSRPLRRINNKVTRVAHAWRPGQVVNLQSYKRGIASMYCRVGDIDRGTLRSGAISLTLLQDVFGLPQTVYVQPEPGVDTGEDDVPKPVEAAAVQEVPYALLAALQPPGELVALPADAGYLFAVATPAGAEIDYSLQVDAGGGYAEQAESDWSATAVNSASVGRSETVISIADARAFDDVVIGAVVLWGSEICRLDAVDLIAGTVTLGRGCADTVPSSHAVGERIWVVDDSIALDATRYSDGATVAAKLLPRAAGQRLDAASAQALTVEFASRAARPYPPAGVTVNGLWPVVGPQSGIITVAWKHRDRVLQADTLVDWTEGDVGPEPGTEYIVRAFDAISAVLLHEGAPTTSASVIFELEWTGQLRVEVVSVRGGLECLQVPETSFQYENSEFQVFTESGTFTVPEGVTAVDVIVVGGGGGGGSRQGGGGGGGGVVVSTVSVTPEDTIAVVVGPGGAGGTAGGRGTNGGNSSFGALTALGGGGAGGRSSNSQGSAGGSGGGSAGGVAIGGEGQGGQGHGGGGSHLPAGNKGGGGGGAGTAGQKAPDGPNLTTNAGAGGDGVQFPMFAGYGDGGWFGGGGGGGAFDTFSTDGGGIGGRGGGGKGDGKGKSTPVTEPAPGMPGMANTGGGGGGSGSGDYVGGAGGAGIIIVSWPAGRIPPTITAARAATVTL